MKLKDRRLAPVGGYWFLYEIESEGGKRAVRVDSEDGGLSNLIRRVESDMKANKHPVPEDLAWQIENQICERQPKDRCWPESRVGDKVAGAIQFVARVADSTIKSITGTSPQLEKKAKECKTCGKRKKKLNQLFDGTK